jgi:hypothetical protein
VITRLMNTKSPLITFVMRGVQLDVMSVQYTFKL